MVVWSEIQYSQVSEELRLDAEFFKPEYKKLDIALEKILETDQLGMLALFVKKGIFDISPTKYLASGIPLIRTFQIKTPIANNNNLVFLSAEDHSKEFSKTELVPGDIVITKIGASIGDVALLPNKYNAYNFSQNVAGVSINRTKINPYYLIAFLISNAGRKQIVRCMMPSGQGKLELRDIKKIKIGRFKNNEDSIANLVQQAEALIEKSSTLYCRAQHLLKFELGLDKLKLKKMIGYPARFSDVVVKGRFDADFFQVSFRQIHKHLDSINTIQLSEVLDLMKGIEVGSKAYVSSGHLFLRVSNIKEKGIEFGDNDKYISEPKFLLLSKSYQPKIGELLLTKDGTPGICYAVDEIIGGIISNGVVRLIPKTNRIPLEYLALVINSEVCRMQIQQECSGALILHWKPSSIRKLKIPLLKASIMKDIADLVTSSKNAQRASIRLLNQAKKRVELLIDEVVVQ
jgi:type I restriction enzyme, S subunit